MNIKCAAVNDASHCCQRALFLVIFKHYFKTILLFYLSVLNFSHMHTQKLLYDFNFFNWQRRIKLQIVGAILTLTALNP